jgi:hypothetical protein
MRLPAEDYCAVTTGLAGGTCYFVLGICMTLFAKDWPSITFLIVTPLAQRARRSGLTEGNIRVIRSIGICLTLLSILILKFAIQHYFWI